MARITKTAANETATFMAENAINPSIQVLRDERKEIITAYAEKAVKPEVLALYDGNVDLQPYFYTRSCFRYACDEMHEDWDWHNTDREFPRTNTGTEYLQVSRPDYDRLIEIKSQISLLNGKKNQLQKKIEATLLSLATYKRIEAEFEEAYKNIPKKYLEPAPVKTLALPIDELKAELLQYK
jgi:hypothetical protein